MRAVQGTDPAFPPFTAEATIGPFYPGIFVASMPQRLDAVAPVLTHHPQGQPIELTARFTDSNGMPVRRVIVEIWQANAHGRYRHPLDHSGRPLDPQFDGFARLNTDNDGTFVFPTIKPGAHSTPTGALRAPHLRWTIFASGIDRIVTQIFFDDEPANGSDPLLASLPDPALRQRLTAQRTPHHDRDGVQAYHIDIVMRGERETPFFDDWS